VSSTQNRLFGLFSRNSVQHAKNEKHSGLLISNTVQIQIREAILEARELRQRSQSLLELAKRAVEIAIENDEDTATTFISQELERLGITLELDPTP
jgi:hypothetical protein